MIIGKSITTVNEQGQIYDWAIGQYKSLARQIIISQSVVTVKETGEVNLQ